MRYQPRTRAYVARRTAEGLSRKEVIRCLKRYMVRDVYTALLADDRALTACDPLEHRDDRRLWRRQRAVRTSDMSNLDACTTRSACSTVSCAVRAARSDR